MVWRRGDEPHAWNRVPDPSDGFVYLMPGQLSAFARLGALRHFNLELIGIHQVMRRDAEASGSHLLDGASLGIAVRQRRKTYFVLATFACFRSSADAVHFDRQSLVRLGADRSERHGAGSKALHDFARRLHFLHRNRPRYLL